MKPKPYVCPIDGCKRRYETRRGASMHVSQSHDEDGPWQNNTYSDQWDKAKQRVIERDGYRCQSCGWHQDKIRDEYDRGLHVHHVHRVDKFRDGDGAIDYEAAEDTDNLVSLCPGCHPKWEGVPIRPVLIEQ